MMGDLIHVQEQGERLMQMSLLFFLNYHFFFLFHHSPARNHLFFLRRLVSSIHPSMHPSIIIGIIYTEYCTIVIVFIYFLLSSLFPLFFVSLFPCGRVCVCVCV